MSSQRLLITSALPYANGDIHIGHLLEYIQSDVFARFQRLIGCDTTFLCASDTHGTPIELKASEMGVPPEDLVARFNHRHHEDFTRFSISFDLFYTTHSEENERHAAAIFEALRRAGLVTAREVDLTFCEHDGRFLPDRYVRGACPRCEAIDQYGDHCEVCGAGYETTEIRDARCTICGDPPTRRVSRHLFIQLDRCRHQIQEWIDGHGHLDSSTANWVRGSFLDELRDWDISRDPPYFGFRIPGEEQEMYFYVWLDAPVGYIATTERYCALTGRNFDEYWRDDATRIVHVIGKDIARFHCVFWPAMLANSGFSLPQRVQVHGFLTVNGRKMSKRTGTAVAARTFLEHFDAELLRFYYACKLGPTNADLDLSGHDFVAKINADLVNKIANLASRAHKLTTRRLDGRLGDLDPHAADLLDRSARRFDHIREAYGGFEFAKALREIIAIADEANLYIQERAPFRIAGDDPEEARRICTTALNLVKVITVLLKPVVPTMAGLLESSLAVEDLTWDDLRFDLIDHQLGTFHRLVDRVTLEQFETMIEAQRRTGAEASPTDP